MKKFKLQNKILSVSIIMLLTNPLFSQSTLRLEDVLATSIKENIDIKIKTNELSQVKNYEKVGVLGVLPKIKLNGSASGNQGTSNLEFATDDFPTIDDAESESKSINGNVEFSYNLFNGLGSIYTYQKLKRQSDLKSVELLIQIEQILLKTAKQYFDVAYLQENNKIISEVLDISKDRYNRIKVQNEFGNASKLDLLSAEIDLNNDSVKLMNSEYELEEAKRQLNQTLNKSLDSEFNVENSVNINRDLIYSDLKQETLKNNNNI